MSTDHHRPSLRIRIVLAAVSGVLAGTARAVMAWLLEHHFPAGH
jgi:hypothetical protein